MARGFTEDATFGALPVDTDAEPDPGFGGEPCVPGSPRRGMGPGGVIIGGPMPPGQFIGPRLVSDCWLGVVGVAAGVDAVDRADETGGDGDQTGCGAGAGVIAIGGGPISTDVGGGTDVTLGWTTGGGVDLTEFSGATGQLE